MNFLVNLEDKGHSKNDLRNIDWTINHLNKNADLNNPESVEIFIAKLQRKTNYKARLAYVYKLYCTYKKIDWKRPRIIRDTTVLRIPTHERIEMIIADSGKLLALKLRFSLETGLRPIELFNLKVKDIDIAQRIVYPTTAKHGAPRKLKISQALTNQIEAYINSNQKTANDQIFKGNPIRYGDEFRTVRNRLAKKLSDDTLRTVRLYDLRHYFATAEYIKTKDIKHVQYLMGHKHSNTTDAYTHVLDCDIEEEYTCKVASNLKEATDLIEHGFQYVTEMDGIKLFKKRK